MSYDSRAVLDAPDQQLQTIQLKLFRGQPLTKGEQQRWANRLATEKETMRVGGQVQGTVVPRAPAAPTARDVGRADTKQAVDYMKGRDDVLGQSGTPKLSPTGQPLTRKSEYTNDANPDEKIDDNANGPHMGADGQPAMWNVPKQVAGRYNGGNLNEGANNAPGTIAMQGADGMMKVWRGGSFTNDRFASLDDAGHNRPIQQPQAPIADADVRATLPEFRRGPSPVASQPAAPATTVDQDKAYIRGAGYGDFLDGMQPSTPMSPGAVGAAAAWNGQAGMMPRPGNRQASLPSASEIAATPANPNAGAGMDSMIEDARRPRPAVPTIDVNGPGTQPAAPTIDVATAGVPVAPPVAQMPDEPPANRGLITSRNPSGPMFPRAIWNGGLGGKPKQYQAAADRFNPFDTSAQKRRSVSVLPE